MVIMTANSPQQRKGMQLAQLESHSNVLQKKKCDEVRPQCSRCQERGQECLYEPVRPRQRRKREAATTFALDAHSSSSGSDRALHSPDATAPPPWTTDTPGTEGPVNSLALELLDPATSKVSSMDRLLAWSPDLPLMSPIDSIDFFPGLNDTILPEPEDDVEEVIRQTPISIHGTRSPSLALIAPVPAPSPLFEFCAPGFSEFSDRTNRRALVDHFCNVMSHLIVFREECGNPFQQLVLPLCQNSQSVMNAVYALASAHLEYRGVDNDEKSVYFHNKAIQGLGQLIKQGAGVNQNELLAAIILLIYYEVVSATSACSRQS